MAAPLRADQPTPEVGLATTKNVLYNAGKREGRPHKSSIYSMFIRHIQLQNFRGAGNIDFNLDRKLNVFYGVNGAGKTSILDVAAKALSWIANRVRASRASGQHLVENDIKNEEKFSKVCIDGQFSDTFNFEIRLIRPRRGYVQHEKSELNIREIVGAISRLLNTEGSLPLLAYYPVNRSVLDIPLRIRKKHSFDTLEAYDDALISAANFRHFFEWFRNREDIENESFRHKKRLEEDPQLHAVRSALHSFLPPFSRWSVRRNPLRMEVTKDNRILRVDQLSDGEKCLMAMTGDIARRLAIANPNKKNPLTGAGIILIDEIDLHLHPTWQGTILPCLTKTFPCCQFLISTHSPHVITHVRHGCLHKMRMENGELKTELPQESYGKTAEDSLSVNMDMPQTRPPSVSDSIGVIYRLIDNNDLLQAKDKIKNLRVEIGNDSELARASMLIARKESIGK